MYSFSIFLIQSIFALILFFLMNWVGAKSISIGYTTMGLEVKDDETPAFNFLLRVLGPVIYIIIIGVVLQSLDLAQYVNELYLITIYYWIIRLLYLIISNRLKLINWIRQVFYWFVSFYPDQMPYLSNFGY